ncbi:MAG: MFS transporter [Puniceicoccaceae bacterium]|nr:MAG: MFS transporter [Puniceicoccaceae bacterium]
MNGAGNGDLPRMPKPWTSRLYELLAEEDDGRFCRDLDDRACRQVPGNFLLQLVANTLTKIGDALGSAKTTLPWILAGMGAPLALASWLVPVRESGSLLPQLLLSARVRGLPIRKWVWVGGSLVEGACMAGMGLAGLYASGLAGGLMVIGLLVLFSLARGACSLAAKDVMGKTIPKQRRGRLSGWMAALSGLVAGGVSLWLVFQSGDNETSRLAAALLFAAGGLWVAAALTYGCIREYPGETSGGVRALDAVADGFRNLKTDAGFRRFVMVRALLVGSALSAPFYVVLGREALGDSIRVLGWFILAGGLADVVSAPFWGRFADRSSRRVMIAAGVSGALLGAVVAGMALREALPGAAGFFFLNFFLLGVIHGGARVGRKTYLVDYASGDRRTTLVAVANTFIGVVLLVMGGLTALLSLGGAPVAIAALAVASAAGGLLAVGLKEVQAD